MYEERTTIPTLIKLFTTKIVANNLMGYFNNLNIFLSFISSISFGVNEKKATSEAEIKAEDNNRNIKITKLKITSVQILNSKIDNSVKKLMGTSSKLEYFS